MTSRPMMFVFLSALTLAAASCSGDSCNEVPSDETSMLQVHQAVVSRMNSSIDDEEAEARATAEEGGGPCASEIAEGNGAGFKCCDKLTKSEIKKQPLCGICLKNEKGAAGKYADCANVYCQAAGHGKVSDKLLAKIAKACAPHKLGLQTPPEGMLAVVANNPMKPKLKDFLADHKKSFKRYTQFMTGTKNSGKMCFMVTGSNPAEFSTESGPYGGDAELAGLLASDAIDGTEYLDGVIFYNDEGEAHKLDIQALINVIESSMSKKRYAFSDGEAKTVLKTLGIH